MALLFLASPHLAPPLDAQSPAGTLSAEALAEDLAIVREAYERLHPGLYRYNDTLAMARHFNDLGGALRRTMTRSEAYLAFSRFLANIRCGHTYANFWNQPDYIQTEVLGGVNKLPFAFRLVDRCRH